MKQTDGRAPFDRGATVEEGNHLPDWDIVISPPRGRVPLDLRQLWEYHELLYFLAWRNLKVRYKQTFLGAAWAVLQPFLTMVVFSIFFGELAGVPSDGNPYPLFAFAALVPWNYFAGNLAQASNSLVEHEAMLTKIYFPRLLLPLAPFVSGLVDFVIAFAILLLIMAAYGLAPTTGIWTIPLLLLLAAVSGWGASLWLSALNVRYRDIRYVTSFLIQFWLFATPIAYPSSLVPEQWRLLYSLNPMVGVVEGMRWALLSRPSFPGAVLAMSTAAACLLLVTGLTYFLQTEKSFADLV